jgi:hypothetical protein
MERVRMKPSLMPGSSILRRPHGRWPIRQASTIAARKGEMAASYKIVFDE